MSNITMSQCIQIYKHRTRRAGEGERETVRESKRDWSCQYNVVEGATRWATRVTYLFLRLLRALAYVCIYCEAVVLCRKPERINTRNRTRLTRLIIIITNEQVTFIFLFFSLLDEAIFCQSPTQQNKRKCLPKYWSKRRKYQIYQIKSSLRIRWCQIDVFFFIPKYVFKYNNNLAQVPYAINRLFIIGRKWTNLILLFTS